MASQKGCPIGLTESAAPRHNGSVSVLVPLLGVLFFGSVFIRLSLIGFSAEERRPLLIILYIGLLLRLSVAICLEVFPQLRLMHEDAGGYELNAMAMAHSWQGLGPPVVLTWEGALNHGYL